MASGKKTGLLSSLAAYDTDSEEDETGTNSIILGQGESGVVVEACDLPGGTFQNCPIQLLMLNWLA